MTAPTLLWFRDDLRLADNPAIDAAAREAAPVVPLFVLDDETPGRWRIGGASRWWLEGSLAALDADLRGRGSRLILRRGAADRVVPAFAAELGAARVLCNRGYEPAARERDLRIEAMLRAQGAALESFAASLLIEPGQLATNEGRPFKVFTPFWRALVARYRPAPALAPPKQLAAPRRWPESDRLEDWKLRPTSPDWAAGFAIWRPGEAAAAERLSRFVEESLPGYGDKRNRPDLPHTSRLSPHLHFGEISPSQAWRSAEDAHARGSGSETDLDAFLAELGWREFSRHLLFHFPELPERPWREEFERFAWRADPAALRAWQRGRTGYPIVDAGMRELWATGWMHNRVRMIAASFLTKHLLIDWRAGEEWFWDTLVDADLANNAASWQWVAGSGVDAAPFFRIFNPVLQGERFDPGGDYVRRWVPELAALPAPDIQRPWTSERLAEAGIVLGHSYPEPIVEHAFARRRALEAYAALPARISPVTRPAQARQRRRS